MACDDKNNFPFPYNLKSPDFYKRMSKIDLNIHPISLDYDYEIYLKESLKKIEMNTKQNIILKSKS